MIDTVRVQLDNVVIPRGFDDEKWSFRPKDFENHVSGKRYFEELMYLRTARFHRDMEDVRVGYNFGRHQLFAEFSVARVASLGLHNIEAPDEEELNLALDVFDRIIAWGLTDFWGKNLFGVQAARVISEDGTVREVPFETPSLPPVRMWAVNRADLFVDYRPRAAPFDAAEKVLLGLQPTGGRSTHKINESTLYVRNRGRRKTREVCIYNKQKQTKNSKRSAKWSDLAERVIRVEVRVKTQRQIAREFGLGTSRPLLRDVIKPDAICDVMLRNLAILQVREGLESVVTIFEELRDRLGPRAARKLTEFIRAMSGRDPTAAAEFVGISQCTARRYIREVRQAGLFPAAVAADGVIEDLLRQVVESTIGRAIPTSEAQQIAPAPDANEAVR